MEEFELAQLDRMFLIQGLATSASIAAAALTFLGPGLLFVAIIAGIVAGWLQFRIYRATRGQYIITLSSEQGQDFAEFFARWYGRDGDHAIYCKDLDWLERPELAPVVEALVQRGRHVEVFVREEHGHVCERLKAAGGTVHKVSPQMRADMKMSYHHDNEVRQLIVRRKSLTRGQEVTFIRTSNPYLLGLAEDVLQACRLSSEEQHAGGE